MNLDDLVKKNGGVRPPQHWECVYEFGGCGRVWEEKLDVCPSCGACVWQVVMFKDSDIKLCDRE